MAQACNPITLGGQHTWIIWGQELKTSLANMVKPHLYLRNKNTKSRWAWRQVPIIPATQEAEAGESLEPESRRLQWAEITPLHSSLVTEQDSISKKKKIQWKLTFIRHKLAVCQEFCIHCYYLIISTIYYYCHFKNIEAESRKIKVSFPRIYS